MNNEISALNNNFHSPFGYSLAPNIFQPENETVTSVSDSFYSQEEQTERNTQEDKPWWHWQNLAKQATFVGLNVGAGAVGFAIGGPIGAALASSGMSVLTSVAEQYLEKGSVDWGLVIIEGIFGAIPGLGTGKAIAGRLFKEAIQSLWDKLLKIFVGEAVEGGLMGSAQAAVTSLYMQIKNGGVDVLKLLGDTVSGLIGGFIGGGLIGGGLSATFSKTANNLSNPENLFKSFREQVRQENLPLIGENYDEISTQNYQIHYENQLRHLNVREKRNNLLRAEEFEKIYDGNDVYYVKWGFRTEEIPRYIAIGTTQLRDCGGIIIDRPSKNLHSAAHIRPEAPVQDYLDYLRSIELTETENPQVFIISGNSAQGYLSIENFIKAVIRYNPKLVSSIHSLSPNLINDEAAKIRGELIQALELNPESHQTRNLFEYFVELIDEGSGFIVCNGEVFRPLAINFQPFQTSFRELEDGGSLKIQQIDFSRLEIPKRNNEQSRLIEKLIGLQLKFAEMGQPFLLRQLAFNEPLYINEVDLNRFLQKVGDIELDSLRNLLETLRNNPEIFSEEISQIFYTSEF
jgi:hypothetical protein